MLDAQANIVFSYWFIALTACGMRKETIAPLVKIVSLHLLWKWDSSKEGFRTYSDMKLCCWVQYFLSHTRPQIHISEYFHSQPQTSQSLAKF